MDPTRTLAAIVISKSGSFEIKTKPDNNYHPQGHRSFTSKDEAMTLEASDNNVHPLRIVRSIGMVVNRFAVV